MPLDRKKKKATQQKSRRSQGSTLAPPTAQQSALQAALTTAAEPSEATTALIENIDFAYHEQEMTDHWVDTYTGITSTAAPEDQGERRRIALRMLFKAEQPDASTVNEIRNLLSGSRATGNARTEADTIIGAFDDYATDIGFTTEAPTEAATEEAGPSTSSRIVDMTAQLQRLMSDVSDITGSSAKGKDKA